MIQCQSYEILRVRHGKSVEIVISKSGKIMDINKIKIMDIFVIIYFFLSYKIC